MIALIFIEPEQPDVIEQLKASGLEVISSNQNCVVVQGPEEQILDSHFIPGVKSITENYKLDVS